MKYDTLNYDLHTHTYFSDGQLSPEALIDRAIERSIDILAITDHDSIEALTPANDYCQKKALSLQLIQGIELSVDSDFGELHLIGLDIDIHHPLLPSIIQKQQNVRKNRAKKLDQQLNHHGIFFILKSIQEQGIKNITRTHFALELFKQGYIKNYQQAFSHYLDNSNIITECPYMPVLKAIQWLNKVAKITLLAHPTAYKLSSRKRGYLIEDFKLMGGDGIEMSYPSLPIHQSAWLEMQRKKYNLLASAGSDFHRPSIPSRDLGQFTPLKKNIPHVLNTL
jgi:predicted metal-dependent phosphoesterase TrpH